MESNIFETGIYILSFIIAVVCHEYAHGYSAYKLGDPTAKMMGRLTLNPIAHIDPIGLITMILFRFGWAKGVPVNSSYFKNRKIGNLIVSSSGILTNLLIALIASMINRNINFGFSMINYFLLILSYVNVMLAVFNLLPIPPLDGSKILYSLLPTKIEYFFIKYERYLYLILIILIFTNSIGKIIWPAINFILGLLYG